MNYEVVMGLEVHTELSTKTKIFCPCTTLFGGEPNTHVCPACSGMPGALPRLNREVVERAIRAGLALNCTITRLSKFDRKNYFYPDLPGAYQISQLYAPICRDGYMDIETDGEEKRIRIRQIHMEEDAGKLLHNPKNDETYMDFNRCGVPLLEIVSQPDFRSSAEVLAYLEQLRETLLFLGVSDCKMQEGSLRADVNLSVRPAGSQELGTRTEMKNLNSFKAISRAIEYEAERQIEILESGGTIIQETRRWDDEKGESAGMRSKENAQDYRYFPEPNLLPVCIDDEWLEAVKNSLPELAHKKRQRYISGYGLSRHEASVLTTHKKISDLFENIANLSGEPLESARLVTGEIMRLLGASGTLPENLETDAGKLAALIKMLCAGKINRNAFKETVEAVYTSNADPEKYITEKGLAMVSDGGAVMEAVKKAIDGNPSAVSDYRAGKEKSFGFLMGQTMKHLGGSANPELVRSKLQEMLKQ